MLFREHKGDLDESMQTVFEFNTIIELVEHMSNLLFPFGMTVTSDMVSITPYIYDHRIGWNTYIVVVKDYGAIGFANGYCD